MAFASFSFYITIWFSKPAHRKAVSRYLQPYERPYQQKRDKQKE